MAGYSVTLIQRDGTREDCGLIFDDWDDAAAVGESFVNDVDDTTVGFQIVSEPASVSTEPETVG